MIRKAVTKDASWLAEISIFAKRTEHRKIFNNDNVSFNEMQGFIRWGKIDSKEAEIFQLYIDIFFQGQGIV